MKQYLRQLPPVHELQKNPMFSQIAQTYSLNESRITSLLKQQIEQIRTDILQDKWDGPEPDEVIFTSIIFERTRKSAKKLSDPYLKKLINGTGTILHTNLGRARLSEKAIDHVLSVAQNYSNLEFKMEEGKRGSRHDIIEGLIKEVTGAEAAMVVNNNSAAVYLILRALAKEKEVIVSRGQLVEIGGSFRVSSIMEESGAILKEVGTTNKTHPYDYEHAISENTAMIMKVHTSNFKTIGFTETVDTETLIDITKKSADIIFYEDLGSGVLFDFRKYGIGEEPVVSEVIKQGADIVSFSGDKLLGGPQAGIIAGKKDIIQRLKKHQLARVLRVDKMTFAALEATLLAYLNEEDSVLEVPTIRDLILPIEQIYERAEHFVGKMKENPSFTCEIRESFSQVGGGTMPDVELPTFVAEIKHQLWNAETLCKQLRLQQPGVVSRLKDEKVIIDFRTIASNEMNALIHAFELLA